MIPRSVSRFLVPVLALAVAASPVAAADLNKVIARPRIDLSSPGKDGMETAVLAGGCFWGVAAVFQRVKGVKQVLAGYSGGAKDTANYEDVITETTGHAEAVRVVFDPKQVRYGDLLRVYFSIAHDPTQLNRQGPDEGTSYRSEIFAATPAQEQVARAYVAQLARDKVFAAPIVTKISRLKAFYPAEAYHQDYLLNHPLQPYIVFNDAPKVAALKRVYPETYSETPVRVVSR